jgi:hypothetical protein
MRPRQWVDVCADDVLRTPGVKEVSACVGRGAAPPPKPAQRVGVTITRRNAPPTRRPRQQMELLRRTPRLSKL